MPPPRPAATRWLVRPFSAGIGIYRGERGGMQCGNASDSGSALGNRRSGRAAPSSRSLVARANKMLGGGIWLSPAGRYFHIHKGYSEKSLADPRKDDQRCQKRNQMGLRRGSNKTPSSRN